MKKIAPDVELGKEVKIHDFANLYGCRIGDHTKIGTFVEIQKGATIGKNCIIGANALISEGKEIPDNSMVLGTPGKIVKTLSEEQGMAIRIGAKHYVENARRFREQLALQTEVEYC